MLFNLGTLVVTPGAYDFLLENCVDWRSLLRRHAQGDWGDMVDEDKKENDYSVNRELRIFSSYNVTDGKVWIITEVDRSCTTILLPSEY